MPEGIIRWKGVDLTNPAMREAHPFKTAIQLFRNEWLIFRLRISLKTAKIEAPNGSRPSDDEALKTAHIARDFLSKLSKNMNKPNNHDGAKTAISDFIGSVKDPQYIASSLVPHFKKCRAIELQQLRQNIDFLYSAYDDHPKHSEDRVWLKHIHTELNRYLMEVKRYGYSNLNAEPITREVGQIPTALVEPISNQRIVGQIIDGDANPNEFRIINPFYSAMTTRRTEANSPISAPEPQAVQASSTSETMPLVVVVETPEEDSSCTSFGSDETWEAASGSGDGPNSSSEDDGQDLHKAPPSGSRSIAMQVEPLAEGNGSIRPNTPLAEMAADEPGKKPAKVVPIGAIWTKEMSIRERRIQSRLHIETLLNYSKRLETATYQTRGVLLRACFYQLNRLADPGLDEFRAENLKAAIQKLGLHVDTLNQVMATLSQVIDEIPSEKRGPARAILQEWNVLASENQSVIRPVTNISPLMTVAVITAIAEVNFDFAPLKT